MLRRLEEGEHAAQRCAKLLSAPAPPKPTPTAGAAAETPAPPTPAVEIPATSTPVPTPIPVLAQAAREEKEKRKRDALLAQRAALSAVLDAGLLPPPCDEPELARRHAELQEEIDAGRLPPLPVDEEEEDQVEEREGEKEEKRGKETHRIPSYYATRILSPPEVPSIRAAVPTPQAEGTPAQMPATVQTGMEVEAPGIQVDNIASGPPFAGAPVKNVDVEMEIESAEDAQVEKPYDGAPPSASGDLDIMEQDDGAWPAPAYTAYQPALPAYMKRHIVTAASLTFERAHPTTPPIDNDLAGDSMDTREHAGYLYDAQPPRCAPKHATHPSTPAALETGDVEMGEVPMDTNVHGTFTGTAAAHRDDGNDLAYVQVCELDVPVNAAGMEADCGAGEGAGDMEEGERGREERAGEARGVEHHAAVEVPTPTPAVALVATLRVDDDEEELSVRPRKVRSYFSADFPEN